MHLCDALTRTAHHRGDPGILGLPDEAMNHPIIAAQLDAAAALAGAMRGAPRFVLADDVIEAATHVVTSRPKSLRDCMSVLRIPWTTAWFEWREHARIDMRRRLGIVVENHKETPSKVGFLVTAEPDGRRGSVRLAWVHATSPLPDLPDISPFSILFDFDAPPGAGGAPPSDEERHQSDLYRRWTHSPEDTAAIAEVGCAFGHWPEPGHQRTYEAIAHENGQVAADAWMAAMMKDVDGEQIGFLSVMLLMTARNAVETLSGEDRTRINKARSRRGESPLLDHVVVRMRLSAAERRDGGGTATQREARRAHLVSGHFVNRQGTIFWRRPHGRGFASGRPAASQRTVMVSI